MVVSGLMGTSCGPTLEEGADARIRVTPPRQITFTRVTVGEERTMPFVVTSVGKDNLDVRKIEWTGSEAVTLIADGSEFPRELTSLASMPVSVEFKPSVSNPSPAGQIKIYTNDTSNPVYTLDVVAQQLAPQIHVSPSSEEKLVFGQTDVGETISRSVVVTNEGDLPLIVSKIALSAPNTMSYEIAGDKQLPIKLEPNHTTSMTLNVAFSPDKTGRVDGNLAITSDDPATPVYNLPIIANSDMPCLMIQPGRLEFSPAVSVGTSQTKTVLLKSCSAVPLEIKDVIQSAGSELFKHQLLDADTPIEYGESARLEVTFSPVSEGTAQAVYTILNNDPLQSNARLTVMAESSSNQCPKASARARLSSASPWETKLDLAPLDTITLDASQSTDKESTMLNYYWSIQKAPTDSTSKIVENSADNGMTASFFLDLAGDYEFCLNVEDTDGMMSCNSSCVEVSVVPKQTIHAQLVWHTPADKTVGDKDGTDLDLHFLTLPDGHWGEQGHPELNDGSDIYFGNREASWVVPGYGVETPSLDRDDKDGEGPENINLDHPAPCRWYAVGVHYYNDNGLGPSYATVRIYIDGKLIHSQPNISFTQTAVFKQIAWIFWDGSSAYIKSAGLAYDKDDDWVGKTPVIPKDVMDGAMAHSPACFRQ